MPQFVEKETIPLPTITTLAVTHAVKVVNEEGQEKVEPACTGHL